MGMRDMSYWMSWLVSYTVINTIVTTLICFTLKIEVIKHSSLIYVWTFIWLYGEAIFGQIVFLQSMFKDTKYASVVSSLIYFAGVIAYSFVKGDGDDASRTSKLFASIMPQAALIEGSVVLAEYEGNGIGINKSTAAIVFFNYSFDTALYMLLLDFIIFLLLGLYMDKVLAVGSGQRLSPCFPCMPSYYKACCCRKRQSTGRKS